MSAVSKQLQTFLFLIHTAPLAGTHTQEQFDFMLASTLYEDTVEILFLGAGIFQLLKHKAPFRSLFQTLKTHYDIKTLYLEKNALATFGLKVTDLLPLEYQILSDCAVNSLLDNPDYGIISF